MRYYFKSIDNDLRFSFYTENGEYIFENDEGKKLKAVIKKIGQDYFYSQDNLKWKRLRNLDKSDHFIFNSQNYKVYKGYKPSSLFQDTSGGMMTQIPGKIIKLNCRVGDDVLPGQTLLILEAMKMENEIKAQVSGKVLSINVSEGQSVEAGTMLIELDV